MIKKMWLECTIFLKWESNLNVIYKNDYNKSLPCRRFLNLSTTNTCIRDLLWVRTLITIGTSFVVPSIWPNKDFTNCSNSETLDFLIA